MKRYTFTITVQEGMDEFWEDSPSDQDVYDMVYDELLKTNVWVEDLKLVKTTNERDWGIILRHSKDNIDDEDND